MTDDAPRFDLSAKHVMLAGKKSTGKSNYLRHLVEHVGSDRVLVYDVNREHGGSGVGRYEPTHRSDKGNDEHRAELNQAVRRLVLDQEPERRPKVLVVEELSRFTSSQRRPPEALMEVIDLNRHYDTGDGDGLGFIGVTRRPSQVHADVFDLADVTVMFRLDGRSDRRRLNDMSAGLGDTVSTLPRYHHAVYDGFSYEVEEPVPEYDTTGSL